MNRLSWYSEWIDHFECGVRYRTDTSVCPGAPGPAIRKAIDDAGWKVSDVDLFEINEAFACVTMAAIKDLDIDPARVNVNGGACALGHPIGATGARLVTTLVHALKRRGLRRGVASQCIGGGEATAIAIEIAD